MSRFARFPRRTLNPLLLQRAVTSGINLSLLARDSGWMHYPDFYAELHSTEVIASPLRIARLEKLASAIGFSGQIFLDEHSPFKEGIVYMPVPRCETCTHFGRSPGVLHCDLLEISVTADFGCVRWKG